jgi:hypothetical protein
MQNLEVPAWHWSKLVWPIQLSHSHNGDTVRVLHVEFHHTVSSVYGNYAILSYIVGNISTYAWFSLHFLLDQPRYFQVTASLNKQITNRRICGSHSGGYEEFCRILHWKSTDGGTCRQHLQPRRISQARNQREVVGKTLQIETTCSSGTSVDFQRTTRCYTKKSELFKQEVFLLLSLILSAGEHTTIEVTSMRYVVRSAVPTTVTVKITVVWNETPYSGSCLLTFFRNVSKCLTIWRHIQGGSNLY